VAAQLLGPAVMVGTPASQAPSSRLSYAVPKAGCLPVPLCLPWEAFGVRVSDGLPGMPCVQLCIRHP
jgi:hypothetical protein